MTGNLSFQIEHHLFPDLPSNRYQEIAPQGAGALRALRPDLHSGSMATQVASAWKKVVRLSLPNNLLRKASEGVTAATSLPRRVVSAVLPDVAGASSAAA